MNEEHLCFRLRYFVPVLSFVVLAVCRPALGKPSSFADTTTIRAIVEKGMDYLGRNPSREIDPDSAAFYFMIALREAKNNGFDELRITTLVNLGDAYIKAKKLDQGRKCFSEALAFYESNGRHKDVLLTKLRYGLSFSKGDSHFYVELVDGRYFEEMMSIFNQALILAREQKNKSVEAELLVRIADFHAVKGALNKSEALYLEAAQLPDADPKQVRHAFGGLLFIHYYRGDFERALYYGTEVINRAGTDEMASDLDQAHFYIGNVYRDYFLQLDKALNSYQRSLAVINHKRDYRYAYPFLIKNMSRIMILQGRPQEALSFVITQRQQHPPFSTIGLALFEESLAICYDAVGRYTSAEAHFEKMTTYTEQLDPLRRIPSYYGISEFYLRRGKYTKARHFLEKLLSAPVGSVPIQIRKNVHLMLFKVDSASSNYMSAIAHYTKHKSLGDSVFNEARGKQIEEFLVKYETMQKEKAIERLSNESKTAYEMLAKANYSRNVIIGGGIMLILLLALSYNRYRSKQRSNLQLELQKREMIEKNTELQTLIREKEWLLKEIHHRVKNNMQIVMSLLNTQSAYINNDEALEAVRHSQQRMYAMSLIHQKLYESEHVGNVDIHPYVRELTHYLKDSYGADNVNFDLQISHVQLDISEAVPVGLILNEAITNSIKYAFPDRPGVVSITISIEADVVTIVIGDDGVGMPTGFDIDKSQTLGLNLIRGLAKQLSANLELKDKKGFCVTLSFRKASNDHLHPEGETLADTAA